MVSYPTVVHRAGAYWATCPQCEWWLSPPQDSRSDALDRRVSHDYFAHKIEPQGLRESATAGKES
jgi:hypothetical protein